jgi:hypothetical protein
MLIIKFLYDGFHYGFPEKFRFIPDAVAPAVDSQRFRFAVIKHQRQSVRPFKMILLVTDPLHIIRLILVANRVGGK